MNHQVTAVLGHAGARMMRAGSLAHDWQMSQQCSWFVDSLRLATPLSILEFFFLIFLPLVGCDQDWVWAGVEPR